eukprot:Filipodium_phascolosomae@DN1271_c0_g1_i2.p1
MKSQVPKQYLLLGGVPLLTHSFDLLAALPALQHLVVVIESRFQYILYNFYAGRLQKVSANHAKLLRRRHKETTERGGEDGGENESGNYLLSENALLNVYFASPGEERSDSVHNGEMCLPSSVEMVLVHDSAQRVISDGERTGAATLAVPVTSTIKRTNDRQSIYVNETIAREGLWEVQTPQVLRRDWMIAGYLQAKRQNITLTDDVSLAEILNKKREYWRRNEAGAAEIYKNE